MPWNIGSITRGIGSAVGAITSSTRPRRRTQRGANNQAIERSLGKLQAANNQIQQLFEKVTSTVINELDANDANGNPIMEGGIYINKAASTSASGAASKIPSLVIATVPSTSTTNTPVFLKGPRSTSSSGPDSMVDTTIQPANCIPFILPTIPPPVTASGASAAVTGTTTMTGGRRKTRRSASRKGRKARKHTRKH